LPKILLSTIACAGRSRSDQYQRSPVFIVTGTSSKELLQLDLADPPAFDSSPKTTISKRIHLQLIADRFLPVTLCHFQNSIINPPCLRPRWRLRRFFRRFFALGLATIM